MKQINREFPFFKLPTLRPTLLVKTIVLICLLIILVLMLFGIYTNNKYTQTMEEQIGIRALHIAQIISENQEVKEAFNKVNPSEVIQPIVERIRETTDSQFIVVGNIKGERYSHPLPDRIGETMVGEDNERAILDGESYISKATGSLGPSIRGKAPIISSTGDIIGVVSVGYLIEDINMSISMYIADIWYWLILSIVIGIIGAILISLHVKKSILGLEPEEIGQLYGEREAIFQSIHEALIAVDKDGMITMYNQKAGKILQSESEYIVGKSITNLLANKSLNLVLKTGKSQYHQEIWIKDDRFIINSVPLFYDKKVIGAVYTFRNQTEIEKLSEELSKVKQYSEALRVQTHEFSNKLNTISGLLQLDKKDEAIAFINKETKQQQEWIHFFINNVEDPYISAILLGKLNQAHELGITLSIDPNSQLTSTLSLKLREGVITAIGNLLNNAYDAVLEHNTKKEVGIFFTDIGNEIIFEIEDSGAGIPHEITQNIFQRGFSTKSGLHRGIGLALIHKILQELNGNISLETSDLGGACFIIAIPKAQRGNMFGGDNLD
ncbi:sensor histidine kinase [Sutcliffiella cohnii]|uniref:sensor histidine kinase n=1 Tax=Sutcliffiella cohnii TaxID=33932 RepID=UPI002E201453|nr:sensor histidine kinase [Sutcliffiella cohnii]